MAIPFIHSSRPSQRLISTQRVRGVKVTEEHGPRWFAFECVCAMRIVFVAVGIRIEERTNIQGRATIRDSGHTLPKKLNRHSICPIHCEMIGVCYRRACACILRYQSGVKTRRRQCPRIRVAACERNVASEALDPRLGMVCCAGNPRLLF